jgi:tetratricopeptide (TPR) repeat protein
VNKRKIILSLFSVFILIAGSQMYGAYISSTKDLPNPTDIDGSTLVTVPPVGVAIETFEERIKQNPNDAVSYTLLGDQYMRQARETGDLSGYQRAEQAFKQSLDLVPHYLPAQTSLASVYYARHEFTRALQLAEQIYEYSHKNVQARIIMADSYLSLGKYQEAEAIYSELGDLNITPPLLARLANLAELKGDSDQALQLIRRAAGDTLRSNGTKENAAWYLLRVGDIYFNRGEIKDAGKFYEASLRIFDDYYLAYAALGRVVAAQGKYEEAIEYYQQAVNIVPQPEFLAALGDLYTVTSQPGQVKIQYDTVEYIGKLAALDKQVYNRQLANFYSDHGLKVDEALHLALAELRVRKDIYGYDTAAWAYYKNGKFTEAQNMMNHAMALDTRDARLYYHAGLIANALHDDQQARRYLEQALAINPYFSILYADEASRILQTLQD